MLSSPKSESNNKSYHELLSGNVNLMQPIVTNWLVEKPKQWHFYLPPTLRASCESVFEAQGVSVSEGLTRLVKLLVEAPDELKPLLLQQAKGDAALALAESIIRKTKRPHRPGVFATLAATTKTGPKKD
jgi:hypothetical protein